MLRWGLLATEDAPTEDAPQDAAGTNPMDAALWQAPAAAAQRDWLDGYRRVAVCPFDHDRRRVSVLVDGPEGGRVLVTKGSPEELLTRCRDVPRHRAAARGGTVATGCTAARRGDQDRPRAAGRVTA